MFGESFNTPGCQVLDAADSLSDRLVQRVRRDDTLNQATSQIEPFLRRQFKRNLC